MQRLLALVCLLIGAALTAWGQAAEVTFSVGWSNFTNSNIGEVPQFGDVPLRFSLDDGIRIGARLAMNSWVFLGHELSYAFQRSGLNTGSGDSQGMTIQNFYYNFVAHATPEGAAVRPFVTGGVGFSSFFPPGVGSLSGAGDTKFGYNFGGGLKFRLSPRFGLRFDLRDHVTSKPFDLPNSSGRLHNLAYSAGFSLLF